MSEHVVLFAVTFVAVIVGVAAYRRIAVRFGIVAVPNERTLHEKIMPRGGGIVIASAFLVAIAVVFLEGALPARWFVAMFVGGLTISIVGFIDDIVHLGMRVRFAIHAALGVWAVAWIGDLHLLDAPWSLALYPLAVVAVMWMINLFNFMDGIDGMAASGATYFCAAATCLVQPSSALQAPLALLGLASLGFLLFNWPPAHLFMGDSGSGFYGFIFAVFVLASIAADQLSLWTWIILLAYFIGDTTTTLLIRIATVDNWPGTHRSHAYQNLARIWNDHRRMTLFAIAIQLLWSLPLAIASTWVPALGPLLAGIALVPPVALAVKYGPLYDR